MDYRDQPGGDPSLRGSQPGGRWDHGAHDPTDHYRAHDPVDHYRAHDPVDHYRAYDPTDHHRPPVTGYGTPSRRRAAERGQQVPADGYLPSWATGAGTAGHPADLGPTAPGADRTGFTGGSGRHRHDPGRPDDHSVRHDPGWPDGRPGPVTTETTSSWRRATETTSWGVPATAAGGRHADHTAEWRIDRYAGHEPAEDRPAWSVAPSAADPDNGYPASPGGYGHHTGQLPPYRAERPAEAGPDWSAAGGWDVPTPVDWQDRTSGDGRWDRHAGTGPWHDGSAPAGRHDDTGDGHLAPWSDRRDTFRSGTRLAGDDPRWMATPASAPRSPVVSWPVSDDRPAATAVPRAPGGAGPVASPDRSPRPGSQRVAVAPGQGRRSLPDPAAGSPGGGGRRSTPEPPEDEQVGGAMAAVLYTAACYLVPVVLLIGWLFTLDGRVPAGCVTDVTGGGCMSPRAFALESMLGGTQRLGLALVASVLMAVMLRWLSSGWRVGSVGLAAAVVGGGLSTLLYSAVSGQPLG
ncbi:hypothetical protein V6U90_06030 [Micromonospora sp. CPCC 206060]|uniref:hypothetical protein n=1 Tax=Micromonospora sp. CPCC 206060 TaxID=3122406 RepID=UPI002FF1C46B